MVCPDKDLSGHGTRRQKEGQTQIERGTDTETERGTDTDRGTRRDKTWEEQHLGEDECDLPTASERHKTRIWPRSQIAPHFKTSPGQKLTQIMQARRMAEKEMKQDGGEDFEKNVGGGG
ncbi:hypothetical protein ACOMHN_037789 [Nucella lapillus]